MKQTKMIMAALTASVMLAGCNKGFNPDGEIGLVSREDGSGTRSAFVELTGVQIKDSNGKKIDRTSPTTMVASSTAVALTTVSSDVASIGYLSLGSINDSVKVLSVDKVMPTREEIAAGRYSLVHPFNVVTRGDVKLTPVSKDFLAWILSEEGQSVVESAGYLRVGKPSPYVWTEGVSGKIVCSGSSSVTPCMEKLKEAYRKTHPQVAIEVQQSDSSTGVSDAKDGVCDLGMASRKLKSSEKEAGLVATAIALDGLGIIVHPQNPMTDISMDNLRKVFIGEIRTWNEVR